MWVINLSASSEAWLLRIAVLLPADHLAALHAALHSLAHLQQPQAIWSTPKKHLSSLQLLFPTTSAPDAVGSEGLPVLPILYN